MTQDFFAVVPAAYLVLTRPAGGAADGSTRGEAPRDAGAAARREVLLQLRQGTPYMDGWWACGAAGHVEAGESTTAAAAREAREELGIEIAPDDLRLAALVHRTIAAATPLEQRFDVFFEVSRWHGEPAVTEPDKAAELRWWPLDALPERTVPHERMALEAIASGHVADHSCPVAPALLSRGFEQTLTLVAAVGRNGVIGDGERMPWHLPDDLRHFKETTLGGVMVMGRGTWDSIGRALPGRTTIVLTRDPQWSAQGAVVARSMPEALLIAGDREVFVVGGGDVYAQTIDHARRLVITEVDQEPAGGVRFPAIDPERWQEVSREQRDGFAFVTLERRDPRTAPVTTAG